jgi:FO synthase
MNESITRAAGALHGEEMAPQAMEQMISRLGRPARQRSTLYGRIGNERRAASLDARPLAEVVNMAESRTRRRRETRNTVVTR